jgi:arylformamidase
MTLPFDISAPLSPATPTWPGDMPFQQQRMWPIGPGCSVNVGCITLASETWRAPEFAKRGWVT